MNLDYGLDSSVIKGQKWFKEQNLQALLSVLNKDGRQARIVGGAVRNMLLGEEVGDIDIATTCLPEEIIDRALRSGFKVIDKAKIFGTIIVVANGRSFEVTTLRRDITTDGRHAIVEFGTNWFDDAKRRDFTINALYLDQDGKLYDPLNGLADIKNNYIRFIDDADIRIKEDYLRILRFFRFYAHYGKGRPDSEALKAAAKYQNNLLNLSSERIFSELKKLLRAKDPMRALRWMRQIGILSLLIIESDKWGIDELPGLIAAEKYFKLDIDYLTRLMAIIAPREIYIKNLAKRLKLPKKDYDRLRSFVQMPAIHHDMSEIDIKKMLYLFGKSSTLDQLKLAMGRFLLKQSDNIDDSFIKYQNFLDFINKWQKIKFPIKGSDLLNIGYEAGPLLGKTIKKLEQHWYESDFSLTKKQLLSLAKKKLA